MEKPVTKVEELAKEVADKFCYLADNMHPNDILPDIREALNSLKEETITECLKAVPEEKEVRHFAAEDDGRSVEVSSTGRHKCNPNCKPDSDEVGHNSCRSTTIERITRLKEKNG